MGLSLHLFLKSWGIKAVPRPMVKRFYDLDTKVESATGRGI